MVITRFAPSPTGYLHIGGARTAIFNYLFAKKMNGKFLLRIEDTDSARSTNDAIEKILHGLKWLGIDWDEDVVFQSSRRERHVEIAKDLVKSGKAYYCFSSQEEIDLLRQNAIKNKESFIFNSPWRNVDSTDYPKDIKPVVRLKVPKNQTVVVDDLVQGKIEVLSDTLDDMVLLRSDCTPTYMLAVVVDDIDMSITHIIRGDDHLTNAARQIALYNAINAKVPHMAHIPMIHGDDGAKLSKRHGALGVDVYQDMGYLSDAIFNYLLRLGWSHGDDEIISRSQAIEWFNIESIGKSPSRIDFDKMNHINGCYIRNSSNQHLLNMILPKIRQKYEVTEVDLDNIMKSMDSIKQRAKLIDDLVDLAIIYTDAKIEIPQENIEQIDLDLLQKVLDYMQTLYFTESNKCFTKEDIEAKFKAFASDHNLKIGNVMKSARIAITGMLNSPSVFEIISIIGIAKSISRVKACII